MLTDRSPETVFHAINDVRGWWSEEIDGSTDILNSEFHYHYKDVHRCSMKITALLPGQKVVWQVLDNHFSFTGDKTEWIGTRIVFDISETDGATTLRFTHEGLVHACECYGVCEEAWTNYIQNSLRSLVETGKGKPNLKEDGYNTTLAQKWQLEA